MSLRRPLLCLLLLPVVTCALAPTPAALAQQPLKIDPFAVQAQGYAAVDVSGTSTGLNPVDLVALDDAGNAAFSFNVGQNAAGQPAEYHVATWSAAGALTAAPTLTLDRTEMQAMTVGGSPQPVPFHYFPSNLLVNGTVFGSAGGHLDGPNIFTGHIFSATGDAVSPYFVPSPYVLLEPSHFSELSAVAPDGSYAGDSLFNAPPTYHPGVNDTGPWQAGFITANGRSDVFDNMAPAAFTGAGSTRAHGQEYFAPYAINAKGWGLGYGYGPGWSPWGNNYQYQLGPQIWNADQQQFVNLDTQAVALNADNDILVSGALNPTTHRHEGAFLIELGNTDQREAFLPAGAGAGLLPANAKEHLRDIQPWWVSNRAHPADTTTVQPVLYVVFTADIQRDPSTWQTATFLLRKLSDGTWDLHEVVGAEQFDLKSINAAGVISAISKANSTVVPPKHAVLLAPVDLAVDADRNGLVEFDKDVTSPAHPFRFWINDDHDSGESGEDESGPANCSDEIINGTRDLEDVTQVKFRLPKVLVEMAKSGKAQLGFKWKDVPPGSPQPAVRLWSGSPDVVKAADYLKDDGVARQVVSQNNFNYDDPQQNARWGLARLVPGTASVWLRDNLMAVATGDAVNLLMEGVSVGTGKLTFVVKVNGVESEGPSVDLKLLNVRQMYERGRVSLGGKGVEAPAIQDPWVNDQPPALGWVWDPCNWPPEVDPYAEKQTIAYVHGWRMTYGEYIQWADTTYKRLWQLGYKGRFYSFRWPTYSGETIGFDPLHYYKPGGLTYNHSEYRAWLSGPALADFVNGLPNPNDRYLIAHSMGNVTSGSALRSGMQVNRYAMCNAAMAAMSYDGTINNFNFITPDTDDDAGTRQNFGLANKLNLDTTKIVSFYLEPDSALGQWVVNNQMFKPQPLDLKTFEIHEYGYFSQFAPGEKLQYGIRVNNLNWITSRIVTALPEAMGYVTQSRSLPAGAVPEVGGSVTSRIDMGQSGFGFGDEHSAEWVYSIQKTYPFWRRLANEFNVDVNNR